MKEKHKMINIRNYFACLIECNNCLVERDGKLYKPADFLHLLEQEAMIDLDSDCFYECCEGFMKSYHYSAKLGRSKDAQSEKHCIGVIYW